MPPTTTTTGARADAALDAVAALDVGARTRDGRGTFRARSGQRVGRLPPLVLGT